MTKITIKPYRNKQTLNWWCRKEINKIPLRSTIMPQHHRDRIT